MVRTRPLPSFSSRHFSLPEINYLFVTFCCLFPPLIYKFLEGREFVYCSVPRNENIIWHIIGTWWKSVDWPGECIINLWPQGRIKPICVSFVCLSFFEFYSLKKLFDIFWNVRFFTFMENQIFIFVWWQLAGLDIGLLLF